MSSSPLSGRQPRGSPQLGCVPRHPNGGPHSVGSLPSLRRHCMAQMAHACVPFFLLSSRSACVHSLQWQRCSTGTAANAASMWYPQPGRGGRHTATVTEAARQWQQRKWGRAEWSSPPPAVGQRRSSAEWSDPSTWAWSRRSSGSRGTSPGRRGGTETGPANTELLDCFEGSAGNGAGRMGGGRWAQAMEGLVEKRLRRCGDGAVIHRTEADSTDAHSEG